MGFLQKVFGSKNQRSLKKLQPIVQQIGRLEKELQTKTDDELRAVTPELKRRLDRGATLDEVLPDAFAVVREAGVRMLGMRHYDVQLIGGMVLHQGKIAEMRTGEGKTLVATLPTYLNALTGKGVHVVTVNDYLARRDAEWMGKVHGFLGLSTGVIVHGIDDLERQRNYNCDITYGQNNEFGFDYLRDNMKTSPDRMVQRGLNFAIVDEVDSILIDEARTPLIISGAGEASADLYVKIDRLIPRLKREVEYVVDEKAHSAMLTDDGVSKMEKMLGVDNLYDPSQIQLVHHVNQALRAHTLYKRNINYLVEDGQVLIIDEHTGRKMPGRRWSDGLHQAVEAKEGVVVEEENQTVATVTFQNYFRMYKKLAGMTGTADTEAAEFHQIYKLDVAVIPTNKPLIRKDHPDLVYKNEVGKFRSVIADIEDCHQRGQPVLVGTVSVEKSEVVANLLKQRNIPFNVLNAKQHQREAIIVAQAGRKAAVTISTNMAGRGTDILLGGNAEAMAKDALANQSASTDTDEPAVVDDRPEEVRLEELTARFRKQCEEERREVLAAGGLKIIGTERHESRRIDNQLRGRAGRQGDPGSSRFYLSLQDDLLRIFGLDKMAGLMERMGLEEDVPIESPMVTRSIEGAQKKVEGRNFDQRKNVLEYDDVMNQQRKTIYALRRQVLDGRYHREPTEEEKKQGIEPAPPTTSGDWTVEALVPDLKTQLEELVRAIQEKPTDDDDEMPEWRALRAEIWRQYGALLEFEDRYGHKDIVEWLAVQVAASLIQQRERLYDLADMRMGALIESILLVDNEDDWNWQGLEDALNEQFNLDFKIRPGTAEEVGGQAWPIIEQRLVDRERELGRSWLMYLQRHFALEEIDEQWIEHLKVMDALREGIGLQGYGQKDPKKEYKRIGFELFGEMMARVQTNTVSKLFRAQIERREEPVPIIEEEHREVTERGAENKSEPDTEKNDSPRAAPDPKGETSRRDRPKVGRNDPCPCGSGKKHKKCHGRPELQE